VRLGFRAAHAGLRVWWFVRRPHTQGVKCIIGDGERVVFVRHTYGDRSAWELPGGGVRRGEPPEATVRREMREELGVELDDLRAAGAIEVAGHGKQTLLHCFAARPRTTELRVAPAEIAEARWAPVTAPPRPLGPHAAAVLDLLPRA
jgi:ADP-ribose pyrophosphatase YjhB (NUDIX family)